MIPGGFLTFSSFPLYRTNELAPRIHNFAALNDQQTAGAIMKVGNIPIVWTVIAVLFFKWAALDRDGPPVPASRPQTRTQTRPSGAPQAPSN
jgi:cytochrome c oxidase assembly factor CtaG